MSGTNQRTLDPPPSPGFSGAAAFDDAGQLAGMVQLSPVRTSSTASSAPQATVASAEAIRRFLQANNIAETASGKLADTTAAVTRVICVRE
jgi:hypothetical protein